MHHIFKDQVEILDLTIIHGNVGDKEPLSKANLLVKTYDKLFEDKRYNSQTLFEKLFIDGIT